MTTLNLHLGSGAPYEVETPHDTEDAVELAADILRAEVGVHAVDVLDGARVVAAHVDRCVNCGAVVTTLVPDEDDMDAECSACSRLAQRVAAMPTLRESRIRWACTGATFAPEAE